MQSRDYSINVFKDEASRLQRWAEYLEGLLNADEPEDLIHFSSFTPAEEIDISQEPPSIEDYNLDKAMHQETKHLEIITSPQSCWKMVETSGNGYGVYMQTDIVMI